MEHDYASAVIPWFVTEWRGKQSAKHVEEIEFRRLTTEDSIDRDTDKPGLLEAEPTPTSWRTRYTTGWRSGAINCALSVTVVFLLNVALTAYGNSNLRDRDGVIVDGDCERTRKLNSYLHLLINILSSIMLSASNYCMQCLSAPTRREVDLAHAKGLSLDIGIPSIRNLKHISKKRVILWFLLGASSLPLHLFYNSVLFGSIAANSYEVFEIEETFLFRDSPANNSIYIGDNAERLRLRARAGTLDRLSNRECIDEYARMYQSFRKDVLVVLQPWPASSGPRPKGGIDDPDIWAYNEVDSSKALDGRTSLRIYAWICPYLSDECSLEVDSIKSKSDSWTISRERKVQYCLSEAAPGRCKLRIIPQIAILVVILNLAKAVIIFYTAFGIKEDPLMNMGDAVSSFLKEEDPTTRDMCLLGLDDTRKPNGIFQPGPREWHGRTFRWKDVTSKRRRITIVVLFTSILILVAVLLSVGLRHMSGPTNLKALADLGFGEVDPQTVIGWPLTAVMANIVMANLPQPILSFLYFCYNGLFTCMLMGYEWSTYSYESKGLRLTRARRGHQRTTYFLQLPYRFGLPLMLLSAVLHWLVSQSIFLVSIDFYSLYGDFRNQSLASCGYSPIAIIAVLILGISMLVGGVAVGFIKYKPGVHLVGSSSAAISAACHLGKNEGSHGSVVAMQKIRWGALNGTGRDGVGHCGFSARAVGVPVKGMMYAGTGMADGDVRRGKRT